MHTGRRAPGRMKAVRTRRVAVDCSAVVDDRGWTQAPSPRADRTLVKHGTACRATRTKARAHTNTVLHERTKCKPEVDEALRTRQQPSDSCDPASFIARLRAWVLSPYTHVTRHAPPPLIAHAWQRAPCFTPRILASVTLVRLWEWGNRCLRWSACACVCVCV